MTATEIKSDYEMLRQSQILTWCVDVNIALMVCVKDIVQRSDLVGVANVGRLDGSINVNNRRGRDSNESAGKEGEGGEMHCV